MSKGIKLSPKHGVNPTIPTCFFCGKGKNEIALLGKIGGKDEDIEAPMNMVLDYAPCDECKALIGDNVLVMGVQSQDTDELRKRLPIQEGLVPYGNWTVMIPEAVQRIFELDDSTFNNVMKHHRLLVDYRILLNLQKQYEELYGKQEGNKNE